MGEAKRKKDAGVYGPPLTDDKVFVRDRRQHNAPQARRGWVPKVVTLRDQEENELKLEIDRDGTAYHPGPGRRRVTDPVLLAVVDELLHPKPVEPAPAEDQAA